jgi:enoyl-CoA hydratase/carnithine racemase
MLRLHAMKTGKWENLLVDVDDSIATITLNRPERLNALSRRLREELAEVIDRLESDEEVRAVVLTGSGDRAFAAGQDLSEAQRFDAEAAGRWVDEWTLLYERVMRFPKPLIAALNGYAVGAGFQLALLCDIRIAADHARFGMPEVDDAIPCITGTWTLYELIGRGRTTDLILTGRMVDAPEALDWGIVTRVVPAGELRREAIKLATFLAAKPATAIRLNKEWLRRLLVGELPATEAYAREAHGEAFASGEPQEKMAAFLSHKAVGRST